MFNNNNFTNFRWACKHILIPSYLIQVNYQNQNITKLKLFGCSAKTSQDWHLKIEPSTSYFILLSLFLTGNILRPKGKSLWQDLFENSPGTPFFFWSPLFKIWNWKLSPKQNGWGLILWWWWGEPFGKMNI